MTNRKKIIEGILHNTHTMRRKLMEGYAHKSDVAMTPSQGFVLHFVAKNKASNVKLIAQSLHITSSAATQLVESLVEKGHLTRKESASDRRVTALSLSPKAKRLFAQFKKHGLQKMTQLFSVLTDDELAQYATLNQKIANSITHQL